MTGAQILELLNQAATLGKGAIQPAGLRYRFYAYRDSNPGPQPWAFGAFDACVVSRATGACEPLDPTRTYRVGTNEFLAPAGGDNFLAFKYMTDLTYWGDMLNLVNAYVSAHYTQASPYRGPNGDGTLDGRIARDGGDAVGSGSIVPLTVLHHNDSHGNVAKGTYVGYTQLATLIRQERAHNPNRTILLNGGDQIQGDAMMYYFKDAPSGFASDGTPLPAELRQHPLIRAMNAVGYDAMTLGNHEFNFGNAVLKGVLGQAQFPVLGANVADDGRYGLASVTGGAGVQPAVEKTVGGVKVAILGLTNHRVPSYELPSNIVGLTFSNPLDAAARAVPALRSRNDVVLALTHIGFTTNPKSVEVDANVDTNLAATVDGIDAIVGAHSHTNPANPEAPFRYLPALVPSPNRTPTLVHHAYRFNNTLGEVILGLRPKASGGYEVVTRAGQYLTVAMSTPEDAAVKAIVDPYASALKAYNDRVVGQTTAPLDTLKAFTEETNGANLQADAARFELAKHGIAGIDFHLSGAMTNKLVAPGATPASPVTLKISDLFAAMPYENSLVVLRMNGPQLKAVLERGYRNYWYYKYVAGFGGYSYYTTCMLDVDAAARLMYRDPAVETAGATPQPPTGDDVVALTVGGKPVDFADAGTYYTVSTVNYLAAGSCNFSDGGHTLWPLDQIVADTQYYVRDAVIDYLAAQGTVSPAVEGRLLFADGTLPAVTIAAPLDGSTLLHPDSLPVVFSATDVPSGIASVEATVDGAPVTSGEVLDLTKLTLGSHTLTVVAKDLYGNSTTESATFTVTATIGSLETLVSRFAADGRIASPLQARTLQKRLLQAQQAASSAKLDQARGQIEAFIEIVLDLRGAGVAPGAADLLVGDARFVLSQR
jgi:2',3'-cyclic-nucleotide 2'-phosphodiesterase (5'-nucleotidase family)